MHKLYGDTFRQYILREKPENMYILPACADIT